MNWLNTHVWFGVFMVSGFVIKFAVQLALSKADGAGGERGGGPRGTGGGKSKKWNSSRVKKFIALAVVFASGLLEAVGALPLIHWLVNFGTGAGGWVSILAGVATLAAGWWSLYGLVALVHDMSDGTPDDKAFTAAFLVPTTLPLGWVALGGLFGNPRGYATGLAAIAVTVITAIFAHKIINFALHAKGHYAWWMWVVFIVSAWVGVVHIPALAYANEWVGNHLPPFAVVIVRSAAVLAAIVLVILGAADLSNKIPEKWAHWAAMYSTPVFLVLVVTVATFQSNAAHSLDILFGVLQ